MQDGVAPYTALTTRRMIFEIFGDRVIGKHFRLSWPPYSPDLTPADFWLWPTLKRMVFNNRSEPFSSVASLKRAITIAFNTLRRRNLRHLKLAVEGRLQQCIANRGFRK